MKCLRGMRSCIFSNANFRSIAHAGTDSENTHPPVERVRTKWVTSVNGAALACMIQSGLKADLRHIAVIGQFGSNAFER